MSTYQYVANVSPLDRFDQIELQRDNGSTVVLARGSFYELSDSEVARVSGYIVLAPGSAPTISSPLSVYKLPVIGTPSNGDVPIWSSSYGTFVPGAAPGGGGSSLTIQDEGSSLIARTKLNFVGAGLTASDDAANARTNVVIDPLLLSGAIVDAKGDMLAAGGADSIARLPVGADGQFLKADSTQSLGVAWASLTAPSAYVVNIEDYGAVADSTAAGVGTDNWTAINNAMAAAATAGGGFVFIPPRTNPFGVKVTVAHGAFAAGPLSVPTGVTLIGSSQTASRLRMLDENLASSKTFITSPLDSNIGMRDVGLIGPAAIQVTGGGIVTAYEHLGRAGSLIAQNITVTGFSYGLRCGNGGTVLIRVSGHSEIGNMREFGILTFDGTYAAATDICTLDLEGIYFHDIGGVPASGGADVQASMDLQHGVYFPPLHNARVRNCLFENITGYGVHVHGTSAAGQYVTVYDCVFKNTAAFDANGSIHTHGCIDTSVAGTTTIERCHFYVPVQYATIVVEGDTIIADCDFRGTTTNVQIKTESTSISGAVRYLLTIDNNRFIANANADIWFSTNAFCEADITRNKFLNGSSFNILVDPPATQTTLRVTSGNLFAPPTLGTACIRLNGGYSATIKDNTFRNPTGTWTIDNANNTTSVYLLRFATNEFAGPGDALRLRTAPSLQGPDQAGQTSDNVGTGTLAAGTYYVRVAALNAQGVSVAGVEIGPTVLASIGKINLYWRPVQGATGYRLYLTTTSGAYTGVSYYDVGVNVTADASGRTLHSGALSGQANSGTGTPLAAPGTAAASPKFTAERNYGTKGYKTENSGIFSGLTTSLGLITISHGLGSTQTGAGITPKTILATPQGSAYMISQENTTDTDFTIGVHDAAGALVASTSVGVIWKVEA